MRESSKIFLKKILSFTSVSLFILWIAVVVYGAMVERPVTINMETAKGQIMKIDFTLPMEQHDSGLEHKKLDDALKEITPKPVTPEAHTLEATIASPLTNQPIAPQPSSPQNTSNIAKIAIVVTNLGTNKMLTEQALTLPKTVTLGFSSYTTTLKPLYQQAIKSGFEVLVYIPFEPRDYPVNDPGPFAILLNNMPDKNLNVLKNIVSNFPGIKGIYGSYREVFSTNQAVFSPLIDFIKQKDLNIFLGRNIANDSPNYLSSYKNIIGGDIVLDLVPDEDAIRHSLTNLVSIAKTKQYAVGYINTYPISLSAISQWMSTLNSNEIKLVPLSEIIAGR